MDHIKLVFIRRYAKVAFIIILMLLGCKSPKPTFIRLKQFDYEITRLYNEKKLTDKGISLIVHGYKRNSKVEKTIDSVAFLNIDEVERYMNYTITFYKGSKKTNVEHLRKNPRDIDRYSQDNDLIYTYSWISGKFVGKTSYRNGIIIGTKNTIRVE